MVSTFVCTTCAGALCDRDSFLECEDCAERFPVRNGIPCFKPSKVYHGEIPQAAMQSLLVDAPREGWRAAYERAVRKRTSIEEYALHGARAKFLEVLPLDGTEKVLDFGCGMGALSVALAERAGHVVALDGVYERAAFVDTRCRQDRIENVSVCACAEPLELPFRDEEFDVIVVNGVLEYMPLAIPDRLDEAQRRALTELSRTLKPGGRLYLAIENRWGYVYWLGYRDHNGLRFTSLLPRPIASLVERLWKGHPYRVATHGLRMYRKLLQASGFPTAKFYWPAPLYQFPEKFVPLDDPRAIEDYVSGISAPSFRQRLKRAGLWLLYKIGALKYVTPDYAIVAVKEEHAAAHAV